MEENLYLNLARADIICSFKEKIIDIEELKYLYRQLNDNDLFLRLIFEIYRTLNNNKEYHNMECITQNETDFIVNIITCVNNITNLKLNAYAYAELWMYLVYIKNNNCFDSVIKRKYLKDISFLFIIDKYFKLEYYNSLMDVVMGITPIDVTELSDVKNKIREII